MHLLLAVLVCLGFSGSTLGWQLPYILNGRDAEIGEFPWQHPDFKYGLSDTDIGLIKLAKDATLDVNTITLAAADGSDMAGADCVITGWGRSKVGSNVSTNIFQAASTRPLTYTACEAAVKNMPIAGPGIINNGHISVGGVGSEGSCHGDSGSPLVCKLEDGSKVLAGVTSWHVPDCDVNYPSIFSRISNFRKWLKDNSGGEV